MTSRIPLIAVFTLPPATYEKTPSWLTQAAPSSDEAKEIPDSEDQVMKEEEESGDEVEMEESEGEEETYMLPDSGPYIG